jgi:hypothetical protein
MKKLLLATLLLTGCATQGDNPNASYFMVSQGEMSLVYRMFVGGVDYCKVTQYNLGGTEFVADVKYDGDTCTVEATATTPEE